MVTEFHENREPSIFSSPLICFFVVIFLFIALLYRQHDLCVLTIFILLVMSAAKAWSILSLARVSCSLRVDKRRVFPGETLCLETMVANAKFLPVWIQILWPSDDALEPVNGHAPLSRQGAGLLWHQRVQLNRELVARRRGYYHVGLSRLQASDFFGFFKKEKRLNDTVAIMVYPRLVAVQTIFLPKRDLFGTFGAKSPVQDPVYILGTQDYQPSRPSRHIHWKASARHHRLQEKVFEPSAQEKILIALDVGGYAENKVADAFEHTLEIIASLSVRLDEMGCAVGFVTNGALKGADISGVPPGRDGRQLPAVLEVLARLQMTPQGPLEQIIRKAPGSRQGLSCVYFAYEQSKATNQMKQFFQTRNIPATLFVWRPASESQQSDMAGIHRIDEIRIQEGRQA